MVGCAQISRSFHDAGWTRKIVSQWPLTTCERAQTKQRFVTLQHLQPLNAFLLADLALRRRAMQIAAWFGCGHTSANDDIDDVVNVIFDDPETINEIAWPTQAEGDLIVLQVADYAPNLAGVMVAGDAKKRATNQRGRTFDRDLHKVDYDGTNHCLHDPCLHDPCLHDPYRGFYCMPFQLRCRIHPPSCCAGNKGHGRQMFLCCTVDTGRMCYLDANYGGRGESYNYHEYDISRQRHRTYWCVPSSRDCSGPIIFAQHAVSFIVTSHFSIIN